MQNKWGVRFSSYSSKCPKPRSKMLSSKFYIKNYSVFPILILCVADMTWLTFCSVKAFQRTDIVVTRQSKQQGELTELLLHPVNRKFWTYQQTFPPNPELHKVYEDMKCEEEKRKEECANM